MTAEIDKTFEKKCPSCGKLLSVDQVGTTCPECLMKLGLESDPSQLGNVAAESEESSNAAHDEETIEQLQPLFPDLELLEEIGRGGMGVVYKARQKHLARLVALKILRAKCSSDPTLLERFTREARALARLAHPHIIGVHDFGQAGDRPYLIMEYVEGINLRSMLDSRALTPQQAMALVSPICDALQFAHEEGIVHRDIKPENILVDRRGRVRIADFGLARLMTRGRDEWTLTGTRQVMGTPHYMAPEQIEHPQEVDHRADIYSLGVVLYEMLTGELPIGRFQAPSSKVQVDVRLDEVVLRTLEKEPARRYQHATDVQTDVQRIAAANDAPKAAVAWPSPVRISDVPWYMLLFGAVVDAVLAIALIPNSVGPRGDFFAGVFHGIVAFLIGYGAWQFRVRQDARWGMIALIASVVPLHFGFLVTAPAAIWLFIVLIRRGEMRVPELSWNSLRRTGDLLQPVANMRWTKPKWLQAFPWRRVFKTLCLAFGWAGIVCLGSAALYEGYGQHRIPATWRIHDDSAAELRTNLFSRANDSPTKETVPETLIRLEGHGSGISYGLEPSSQTMRRNRVSLSVFRWLQNSNKFGELKVPNSSNPFESTTRANRAFAQSSLQFHLSDPEDLTYAVEPCHAPYGSILVRNLRDEEIALNLGLVASATYSRQSSGMVAGVNHDFQFRPSLDNATPIANWLTEAGVESDDAKATADCIFAMINELANSGGVLVDGSSARAKVKPISMLLGELQTWSHPTTGVSIRVEPQDWALLTWIWSTIALAALGAILIVYRGGSVARTS